MNPDGSYSITDVDIYDTSNLFGPGRQEDIRRATEYVEYRECWKFNRSRNICMGFVFGLCFALLSVGILIEIF
jgi:hypothetical protein